MYQRASHESYGMRFCVKESSSSSGRKEKMCGRVLASTACGGIAAQIFVLK